jgi:hypothetical protein
MTLNVNSIEWHEFFLKDIFTDVQRGKRLTKANQVLGEMPYTSSTALSNGVDNFIGNNTGVRVFSNCLTVANSGSVGASFYQPYKFVASDHITHLKSPLFNSRHYLFIATQTNRLSGKYNFNREINDKRISREKVMLPVAGDGQPDFEFMNNFAKDILEEKKANYVKYCTQQLAKLPFKEIQPLKDKEWDEFSIEDIAEVSSGKRLTKADMITGNKPFIGSSDSNNGITEFVSNTNQSEDSNVLGVNYNGSVVENFYHPYKAIFSDDVKRLSLKEVAGNKHLYLFIKNSILMQKSKYQYAYKFNEKRLKRQKIMLPINDSGEPDYEYMEQYMINMEFKKREQYLSYLD